jgi:hypothetical protein
MMMMFVYVLELIRYYCTGTYYCMMLIAVHF